MRNRDEARLQQIIVAWCRNNGIRPVHVANEHVRNAAQAAIAKREGMEPGIPDLLIFERCPADPSVRGVAFELKTPTGRVTAGQIACMERLTDHGWLCYVVRSKEQAVDILQSLGFGRKEES